MYKNICVNSRLLYNDVNAFRICDSSKHNIELDAIRQSSELWLQFDNRTDAFLFFQKILTHNRKIFVLNYADFEHIPSYTVESIKSSNGKNFSCLSNSYGIKMLESLGYLFQDKYLMDKEHIQSQFISCYQQSPEQFDKLCCNLWKQLQKDHCYFIGNIFNDKSIYDKLARHKCQVPHVIVTPLRTLFQPMHEANAHRAMRIHNKTKDYEWMLVYFRDEDTFSKISNINESDELRNRYKIILKSGICLTSPENKSLTYIYFASSGSQSKKQEYWFLAPPNANSANAASLVNEARLALGDLRQIKNVAKFIARVGLYVTTTKSTDVRLKQAHTISVE